MDARILLIEDDPSIREVTAIGLRAAGFTVATADDGVAGLDRFRAEPFDLVLLDIMLPRLDGLEVCRQIRHTSTVPLVMLTARADTIDIVVGLGAGADDYVRKPFEVPELVARVRPALRRALGGGALVIVVISLLAARSIARRVLSPVTAAALAAERIERGDLSARVPVTSRDEFGAWAERFNRMAASLGETIGRLETAQAQNRRFVADVAHELRTPLAALVAEASILRDHLDTLPPDSRRAGELLVADAARLRSLVDDLMELSRFDAAAEHLSPEPVDLGRLVGAVSAARLPGASLRLPDRRLIIASEPRRLERIVGNLLDNAREHAPGAPVEVSVAVEGDGVIVAVDDGGPGVPPEQLGRIFERFHKVDPSRHDGSSGLGLAIAAEHATVLGGSLRATNRPTGGLRVELRLPVS